MDVNLWRWLNTAMGLVLVGLIPYTGYLGYKLKECDCYKWAHIRAVVGVYLVVGCAGLLNMNFMPEGAFVPWWHTLSSRIFGILFILASVFNALWFEYHKYVAYPAMAFGLISTVTALIIAWW